MSWHPEILSRTQQRVLTELGPILTRHGFYLAGGTALALHLGHRRSVDLDWFTGERLPDPLRLAGRLRELAPSFVTEQVAPGTLYGTARGVRLGLLEYRYPLLGALRPWRQCANLASRRDLAAMKLAAVAQRGAKKDFVDIYALGSRRLSLRLMLRCYQGKYAINDLAHVLYSLAYFDDADRERMPALLWNVKWRIVKDAIRSWVREVTR
jgi:Nucleotidyl transferase AbiEii toxin, Type IV TA system